MEEQAEDIKRCLTSSLEKFRGEIDENASLWELITKIDWYILVIFKNLWTNNDVNVCKPSKIKGFGAFWDTEKPLENIK